MNRNLLLGVAALSLAAATPALAHVTLLTKEAATGSSYMAELRVPRGCAGAATIAVRIHIPAGVFGVKPQPKANWKIDVKTGKYAAAFANKGASLTEGVIQVSWSGGNLPGAFNDEFVLSVSLADSLKPNTTLYFPVVRECEGGIIDRWIEIPTAGKAADDHKTLAPGLRLVAP